MGMLELINFRRVTTGADNELPEIFSLGIPCEDFAKLNITYLYKKILTDCIVRTQGIPDNVRRALWDNCMASESDKGLISLLATAMTAKSELYLVWNLNVLRKANAQEQIIIKADYAKMGKSSVGAYISFRNYELSDILLIYASLEHASLASLSSMMNLAKAIQFKMANMRKSVGAYDKDDVVKQCVAIATALKAGKAVAIDGEDEITTSQLDMEPTEKAVSFLDSKRAYYTGLPKSYITGEQTGGIGSSGENDTRAIQRGLEPYWESIIHPTLKAVFNIDTKFQLERFGQVDSALNALRTFELVSEDLISLENKREIVSDMFDIENDLKNQPKEELPEIVVPNADTARS